MCESIEQKDDRGTYWIPWANSNYVNCTYGDILRMEGSTEYTWLLPFFAQVYPKEKFYLVLA